MASEGLFYNLRQRSWLHDSCEGAYSLWIDLEGADELGIHGTLDFQGPLQLDKRKIPVPQVSQLWWQFPPITGRRFERNWDDHRPASRDWQPSA